MDAPVLCAVAGGVATLTLNRPDKRNALNTALLAGLDRHVAELEARDDVRVIVVRGAGPAFCAGMDLDELLARHAAAADPEADVTAVLARIERARHPTLAVVHGDAFAGGCELALHCDLRIAAETARLAMPLARLGIVVPWVLGRKLVEVVGAAHAREILLVGRPLDAARALAIGLVHRVVPAAGIEAATAELAATLAGNAPLAVRAMKATVLRAAADRDGIAHDDLDELARRARASADAEEGIRAMLAKRRPSFRGE